MMGLLCRDVFILVLLFTTVSGEDSFDAGFRDGFGAGVSAGFAMSLIMAGVIVGVILTILRRKRRFLKEDVRRDTAQDHVNLASSTDGVAGTSGVNKPASPSNYEDLKSETRENTATNYEQLSVYQN